MEKYLTMNDVCSYTRYSRWSIRMFVKSGKLKAYKPNGKVLFKKEDVENFLNQKKDYGGTK